MHTLNLVDSFLQSEGARKDQVVVYHSPDGETGWKPVPLDRVPAFIRSKEVLENLLNSNSSVTNSQDPDCGFYTAMRLSEALELAKAGEIQRRHPRLVGPDGKPLTIPSTSH